MLSLQNVAQRSYMQSMGYSQNAGMAGVQMPYYGALPNGVGGVPNGVGGGYSSGSINYNNRNYNYNYNYNGAPPAAAPGSGGGSSGSSSSSSSNAAADTITRI